MSDLISREETLKAMDTWDKFGYDAYGRLFPLRSQDELHLYVPYVHYADMINVVKGMPSAQKTGKWEMTEVRQYDLAYGGRIYVPEYRCSCCGHWYESYIRGDEPKMPDDADFPKYCEQCGARMENES